MDDISYNYIFGTIKRMEINVIHLDYIIDILYIYKDSFEYLCYMIRYVTLKEQKFILEITLNVCYNNIIRISEEVNINQEHANFPYI